CLTFVHASEFAVHRLSDVRVRAALLIIRVWDEVSKTSRLPAELWEITERWTNEQIRSSGRLINLLRPELEGPQCFSISASPNSTPRVFATGMVERIQDADDQLIAPATVSTPIPVPSLYH